MSDERKPRISPEQIEQNFAEISPPMTAAEALAEANRCLYCYEAPCTRACPTHIDVPSFIKRIASNDMRGSAHVIFDANPIGATCARVCPVDLLCEGACVENELSNRPIEIGRLQRYATDHAAAADKPLFERAPANGRTVGVVGSGPAGISCATYLVRLGYAVKVYEKRPLGGGLDTYGMAEYKMTQAVSQSEVEQAAALGVEFLMNTVVGIETETPKDSQSRFPQSDDIPPQSVAFADLRSWHDAIFLGVGLGSSNRLELPGEELDGVYDALSLIETIKARDWENVPVKDVIVVVGAGNTAIDAATQLKRLGAEKVVILYRRSESEMPAFGYEYELAKQDGVEFIWNAAPIGILSDDAGRNVTAIRCERTDGSMEVFEIPCGMLVKAIGQRKLTRYFQNVVGVEVDAGGRVVVNSAMQTSDPQIFAGGDCVNGGGEAVNAAQMGKLAAIGIHRMLTGETVEFAGAREAQIPV